MKKQILADLFKNCYKLKEYSFKPLNKNCCATHSRIPTIKIFLSTFE